MDELEESEVDRELLLGNASVRPEPGTQERPEAFHGVDVDLTVAVAVLVPSVLTPAMADRIMFVAPGQKPVIDVVLVSIDQGPLGNTLIDDWLDRDLLDVREHMKDDLSSSLDQAEDRRFFFFQSASSRRTLEPAAASLVAFFLTASGFPLCPATT